MKNKASQDKPKYVIHHRDTYKATIEEKLKENPDGLSRDSILNLFGSSNMRKAETALRELLSVGIVRRELKTKLFHYAPTPSDSKRFAPSIFELVEAEAKSKPDSSKAAIQPQSKKQKLNNFKAMPAYSKPIMASPPQPVTMPKSQAYSPTLFLPVQLNEQVKLPSFTELLRSVGLLRDGVLPKDCYADVQTVAFTSYPLNK